MKPEILTIQKKDDFYLWLDSKVPRFRYKRITIYPTIFVLGLSATMASGIFLNSLPTDLRYYQSLIAGMVYWISAAIDDETSRRLVNSINRFEQQSGVTSPFIESNPFASERPTLDFFSSFHMRAIDAVACTLSILVPTAGIGIGIVKLYAGFSNYRAESFHERRLKDYT